MVFFTPETNLFAQTSINQSTTQGDGTGGSFPGNGNTSDTTDTSTRAGMGQDFAISNCVITKVGEPNISPSPPQECLSQGIGFNGSLGVCQNPPTVNFTIQQYIGDVQAKWGIYLRNLTLDQVQMIWEEFYEISCTGILQDIRGTVVEGWGNAYSQQFSCPQDADVDVRFGVHHGTFVKALILHELTHVWQFCSKRGEANRLKIPEAYRAEGGLTNYSRGGCPQFASGFPSLYNEDHADTIALYLNPTIGELTCGGGKPNPFSGGGYPLHRNIAREATGK